MLKNKKILALFIAVDTLIIAIALAVGVYSGKLVVTSPAHTAAVAELAAHDQKLQQIETELASASAQLTQLQQTIATPSDPTQLTQLQAQLKAKQSEVYAAKVQYNDYYQGQMVLKRGQAAIDLYKNNYPFILDPNLPVLTAQAKAKYDQLLAEQTQLQQQVAALTETQQQAAQNLATAQTQLSAVENKLQELTVEKTELEHTRAQLVTNLTATKHWTQRLQEWLRELVD